MSTQAEDNLDSVIADLIDNDDSDETATQASPFEGLAADGESFDGPPVQLTERAAKQVQKIIQQEQFQDTLYLRVAVEGGGCSGLSYKLGFDHKTEDDRLLESHDVELVVDTKHIMYLQGIVIDYPDGLDARGFIFDNPNASETCGCGSSFAT